MKTPRQFQQLCLILGLLAAACGSASPAAPTLPPAASAVAATAAQTAAALQPVHFCYAARSGANAILWYAFEKGLFQKYGLQPDLTYIAGPPNVVTALVSHQVDFCQNAGSNVVNAVVAGQDMVMIQGFYDRMLFDLIVGPAIQKPADLAGKSIAIGAAGSVKETAARLALQHFGLQPDSQVSFTPFRNNDEPAMAAAVENGTLAGAILAPPLLAQYRAAGLHNLLDISTLDSFYLRLGLASTRGFIAAHRDVALAVVKANLEAIARMKNDPAGTQAVMAKYMSFDPVANQADLAEAYDVFIVRYLVPVPRLSTPALQAVIDEAALTNPEAAKIQPDQLVDLSLLQDVVDSGFLDTLPK